MITYMYWAVVLGFAIFLFYAFGIKAKQWKAAAIAAVVVVLVGWTANIFYFENLFVKRFGGVMTIKTQEGRQHIGTTWKDDNLWVEEYEPATNTCIFSEYSRGNLLQGRVIIKTATRWVTQALTSLSNRSQQAAYFSGKLHL